MNSSNPVLFFQKMGSGFPLVILHGLFGSGDNWLSIAKHLSSEFTVYLLDLRNHGRSFHHSDMNYRVMAEDIHVLFKEQGIQTAFLIGHSMGGKTVMRFADMYPEQVAKCVIVDIAPVSYPSHHLDIFDALRSIKLNEACSRMDVEQELNTKLNNRALSSFLLKNIAWKNGIMTWKCNLEALENHYSELLADPKLTRIFQNPTLFIKGENSSYILPQYFETIRDFYPSAVIETIPKANHWVQVHSPTRFLGILLNFLR